MQKLVFTNGGGQTIDLTSGNFGITNWEGLSGVGLNIQTQQVPFQDGGVFLDALMEQREISVTVAIQDNNDLSARYERKRQLISALNPKLGEGVLVYTNDYLARQIKAVPQLPIFENKNSNDSGTLKAEVTFSCPSPYWEDLEDTVVSFDIGEIMTIENNGDIPAQVQIEFNGSASNPQIINSTTNKKIEVGTTLLSLPIEVNTEIGNKSATLEELKFELKNWGGEINDIKKIKNKIYAVGKNGVILISDDGYNWELADSGTTDTLNCIFYSEKKQMFFIGTWLNILSSQDGKNWEKHFVSVINVYSITEKDQTLVAVCQEGKIFSSTDGTTWTTRTSGVSVNLKSVASSNNIIVAIGEQGTVISSTDGITWTTRTSGVSVNLNKIIHDNNLFIIVGNDGAVIYSSNGTNWYLQTNTATSNLFDIAFYRNVGGFDIYYISGENGLLLEYDTYGINQITSGLSFDLKCICYFSELGLFFVGNNDIYVSADLTQNVWNVSHKCFTDRLYGVLWIDELEYFVAIGENGTVLISQDKETWRKANIETTSALCGLCWSKELQKLCIVGAGVVLTSQNLIDWNIVELQGIGRGVTYSEIYHKFFLVGGAYFSSEDGENWNYIDDYGGEMGWCIGASDVDGTLMAGGYNYLYSSEDGNNWVLEGGSMGTNYKGLKYQEGFIYCVNSIDGNRTIWFGNNMISLPNYQSRQLLDVIYSKQRNQIIATVDNGEVAICVKDKATVYKTGINEPLFGITYSKKYDCYVVVGEDGTIIASKDIKIENMIQHLSPDSDMTFNLQIGENKLRLQRLGNGYLQCRIKYRQKYIGV